jgi:hypothetical protein
MKDKDKVINFLKEDSLGIFVDYSYICLSKYIDDQNKEF